MFEFFKKVIFEEQRDEKSTGTYVIEVAELNLKCPQRPADRGNRHISEIEVTEFTSDVKCLDDELVIGRKVRGRGRRRQRTEPETFIPGDSAGQKRREERE